MEYNLDKTKNQLYYSLFKSVYFDDNYKLKCSFNEIIFKYFDDIDNQNLIFYNNLELFKLELIIINFIYYNITENSKKNLLIIIPDNNVNMFYSYLSKLVYLLNVNIQIKHLYSNNFDLLNENSNYTINIYTIRIKTFNNYMQYFYSDDCSIDYIICSCDNFIIYKNIIPFINLINKNKIGTKFIIYGEKIPTLHKNDILHNFKKVCLNNTNYLNKLYFPKINIYKYNILHNILESYNLYYTIIYCKTDIDELKNFFNNNNIGYKVIPNNMSKLYKYNNFYDIFEVNNFNESLKCYMFRFFIITDIEMIKFVLNIPEFENLILLDDFDCFNQYKNIMYNIKNIKNIFFTENVNKEILSECYNINKINYI